MAAASRAQVLTTSRDRVGECPVWDVAAQALYWVDIESQRIHRWEWATRRQLTWQLPERVGCIALAQGGGLVAAMETGIYAVGLGAPPAASLACLARIEHPMLGMRFNDGRCDAQGRLWVGTLCMDMSRAAPVGALVRFDENGLSAPLVEGLITPNGLAFSPDGRTLYLSDSHPSVQKIWAFELDPAAGTLSRRRLLVDMQPLPGRPDGAAIDEHGHYWVCANDAAQVHCFDADGQLLRSLDVPVSKPSMCAFGGPGLDTLFVTSIRPDGVAPSDQPLAGAVFTLQPGVRGRAEPVFGRSTSGA